MKEKGCNPLGGRCFLSRTENYPLCKAMVDHNQERVKARGGGKISDEVAGQLLEWTGGGGANGVKGGYCGMCISLGLLTISTSFDVFSYELGEAGPPVVGCHELAGLKVSRVAS